MFAGASENASHISESEAALYDRQIRLWGLEAQKRLRQSSILVAGLSGLGAEVAKNLILAGVKSITLLDHNSAINDDSANFLSDRQYTGKNKAESCQARAQELNPMVKVLVDTDDLNSKSEVFFKSFTAVCIIGHTKETLMKVNAACRKFGVKFYAGDVWGYNGFVFADLSQHTYLHERVIHPPKTNTVGEQIAKKLRTEEQTEVTKKTIEYITLEKALAVKSGKSGLGLVKRTSPVFFLVHVILKFMSQHGRPPSAQHKQSDCNELIGLRDEIFQDLGMDPTRLKDDFVRNIFGELSPICAVVGGILAQDVIKVVSGKGMPIINCFLFDGKMCTGVVERIGV